MSIIARLTGYYPSHDPGEGGFQDAHGRPLQTLQGWLNNTRNVFTRGADGEVIGLAPRFGRAQYVSVAAEPNLKQGARFSMPDFDTWAAARGHLCPPIVFQLVDHGDEAFFPTGSGWDHLDVCVDNKQDSLDPFLNKRHAIVLLDTQA